MPQKQFMLGIDVGGQTVKSGLYVVEGDSLANKAQWIDHVETAKGVDEHSLQIVGIIDKAVDLAKSLEGLIIGVGIATPGRFGIDGIIKPGTNPNVGRFVREFDGIHLRGEYVRVMQAKNPELLSIPFNVKNDGNAMLAGMIKSIQSKQRPDMYDHREKILKPHCIVGKYVGLIGLGTGLGHAIVHIDSEHRYHFVTDGHASKLRITVDEDDLRLVVEAGEKLKAATGREELIICDDGTVRAEDLYRSPMVNTMAGVDDGAQLDIVANPRHLHAIQLAGKYLGRTMTVIHSGENSDIEPANGWSEEEKQLAAKTSIYLFGGGLGRSPLGLELIKYADEELQNHAIDTIRMVQIPDTNVATHAAAIMAFDSLKMGIMEAI